MINMCCVYPALHTFLRGALSGFSPSTIMVFWGVTRPNLARPQQPTPPGTHVCNQRTRDFLSVVC